MKRVFKFILMSIVFVLRFALQFPFLLVSATLSMLQIIVAYVATPFEILSIWLMFLKEGKFNHWIARAKLEFQKTHTKVVNTFKVKI